MACGGGGGGRGRTFVGGACAAALGHGLLWWGYCRGRGWEEGEEVVSVAVGRCGWLVESECERECEDAGREEGIFIYAINKGCIPRTCVCLGCLGHGISSSTCFLHPHTKLKATFSKVLVVRGVHTNTKNAQPTQNCSNSQNPMQAIARLSDDELLFVSPPPPTLHTLFCLRVCVFLVFVFL